MMEQRTKIFCCYTREDLPFLNALKIHLMPLVRERLVTIWADTDINAGQEWEEEIQKHLNEAEIILLLVSPDFIASDYCYSKEMMQAMKRHERGEAWVIPIILRPVSWKKTPLGKLQALPPNAIPITSRKWHQQDDAFYHVAEGIRDAVEALRIRKLDPEVRSPDQPDADGADTPFFPDPRTDPTRPIHLVTNHEYLQVVQQRGLLRSRLWRPSAPYFSDDQADAPVTGVSWDEAVTYCDWVGSCLPTTLCKTSTENTAATITDTSEIGEWHDAGTEQQKLICNPYTLRLMTKANYDVPLSNVGFRCESVIPPSPSTSVFIAEGFYNIGTDIVRFNQLAAIYQTPQNQRRPILGRPVQLTRIRGFSISTTCVTNEEFFRFTREEGHRWPEHWDARWLKLFGHPFPTRLASRPVVNVSVEDAKAYCRSLPRTRLPTWEEWECAASGQPKRPYPWGTDYSAAYCNSKESGRGSLAAVDEYSSGNSSQGVRQLCGNIWEWIVGPDGKYEIRGGSYRMPCELWGLAYAFLQPDGIGFLDRDIGFRVVTY